MAKEYDSFSDKDSPYIGGFRQSFGTGWTASGLFSTAAGIPLAFSMDVEDDLDYSSYAPGVTTIGDLLESRGYNQEFICGSDADFASRSNFYEQHGSFDILDYPEAINRGFIPADYKAWWGFEDRVLYDIAKKEATRLAAMDEPFNLTLLTVDTHMVDGYICPLCENKYPQKAANIVACADNQVYNFVEWCKEQDFFEDTVIVITGDHPRHDSSLVAGVAMEHRPVYNCIINSSVESENKFNRVFTHMDIFPTTIAAMGYEIEGDKLGLGTNLYSDKATLAEELGFDNMDRELSKYSTYYIDRFTKEK
jgi:phosphoglycerol transferase